MAANTTKSATGRKVRILPPPPDWKAEIVRQRQEISALREQMLRLLAAQDDRLAALLPEHENASRYQRMRAICSDRTAIHEFLNEGKGL